MRRFKQNLKRLLKCGDRVRGEQGRAPVYRLMECGGKRAKGARHRFCHPDHLHFPVPNLSVPFSSPSGVTVRPCSLRTLPPPHQAGRAARGRWCKGSMPLALWGHEPALGRTTTGPRSQRVQLAKFCAARHRAVRFMEAAGARGKRHTRARRRSQRRCLGVTLPPHPKTRAGLSTLRFMP